MRCRALLVGVCLAALLVGGAAAMSADTPSAAAKPRAITYVMWNDDLLFLGARVDDVNLTGASLGPLSEAWRDDSIDFYLDTSGASADAPHPGCVRLVVSAAGGFAVLQGTEAGTWRAQPGMLAGIKLGVEHEGTLNHPGDRDTGYTVEAGIPWRFLGGPPKPGQSIGFNVVVRMRGENDTFVSWSSRVTSPDDLDHSRLWATMVLAPGRTPSVAQNDEVVCPYSYGAPVVDGRVSASEWMTASVVQLDLPTPTLVAEPTVGRNPACRLLATYRYDYNAPRTAEGRSSLATALAHQPADGLGAWFSADSVAWHRAMLRQARAAAVDVILPIYAGDDAARRTWSRLGLLRLVQALNETREARTSYPLVGMYLDAGSLARAGVTDLTVAESRRALWAMIAEFFAIVPDEFRAQFDLTSEQPSCIVVLGPPQGLQNWDDAVAGYLRDNFRRMFGANLVLLADDGWQAHPSAFDGYCALQEPRGVSRSAPGGRSVVRLMPGYSGPAGLLGRREMAYEQNWVSAMGARSDFILLDSLNDFAVGSEIADSRQYDARYLDITRQSAQVMAGRRNLAISLRRQTVPAVLQPGTTYKIEMLLDNQGFQDLTPAEGVELSYTLQSKDRPDVQVSDVANASPVILAGQRAPLAAAISTKTPDGPLPVGDYDLSFAVTKRSIPVLHTKWLTKELSAFTIPVHIARARDYQATILSSTLPAALTSGARQRVRVRLRNDGSRPWDAQQCALSYHWLRLPGRGAATAEPEIIEFEGVRTPLPESVAPGEWVSMYAVVEMRTADGKALPAWTPADDWLYGLQWDVIEGGDRWFTRAGGVSPSQAVAVLAPTVQATVVNSETPARLDAAKGYDLKVVVRNDGPDAWQAGDCRLTYQWCYWDGAPVSAPVVAATMDKAVPAGEATLVAAHLTAPTAAGSYRLAWDVESGGAFVSQSLHAESGAPLVQPVTVSGGAFEALDLSAQLNVQAASSEGYGPRGAFDASGLSLPAEFIPPDASRVFVPGATPAPQLFPGEYYTAADGSASLARVPLLYPSKDQRGSRAIACTGQTVKLPAYPISAIYIAACASESLQAGFQVVYADGATAAKALDVPAWNVLQPGVPVAVRTPILRGAEGDRPTAGYIYLLRIGDLAATAAPVALVLPNAPQVKVFAVTVERSQ